MELVVNKFQRYKFHFVKQKGLNIAMKIFQKIKNGEKRQIIIFGFIKINYKRKVKKANNFENFRIWLLSKVTLGKTRERYINKYEQLHPQNPKIIQKNINASKATLLKRIKNGKKIVVYFVAYEKSQWIFQSLYDSMKKDELFEPKVLCLNAWVRENVDKNASEDLVKFFENKNMNIVKSIDENNLPDIIFVAFHMLKHIKLDLELDKAYKKILFCYLPYYWIIEEERVDSWYLSHENTKYFWKEFVHDQREYKAAMTNPVKGKNVILSGHPKTDEILRASDECPLWKSKDAKKIIWAPHWSLYNHPVAKATFDRYYIQMFDYVKKHPEIQMVIKPHPLLKSFIGNKKMQKEWNADIKITVEEYEEYLERWKNLPNGNVHDSGDYFDLFKSSDAMILDSMSFIAEYGFLNKPMCYCSKPATYEEFSKRFNNMALEILDTVNIAYEWYDIINFIENSVLKNIDTQKEHRQHVIDKWLITNSGHVGEFVKNEIKNELYGRRILKI